MLQTKVKLCTGSFDRSPFSVPAGSVDFTSFLLPKAFPPE